jgi:hypothetical protein
MKTSLFQHLGSATSPNIHKDRRSGGAYTGPLWRRPRLEFPTEPEQLVQIVLHT